MDFAQRSSTPTSTGAAAPKGTGSKKLDKRWSMLVRWASLVMFASITIILFAVISSIAFSKTHEQGKFVDTKHYQAVFLNGGQVYFGRIGNINDKYLTVSDIYYLRVNQTVQPGKTDSTNNDVSLVKLGCELHGPQDQMVINTDQIIFWENLKGDGQVAKAVEQYQKQNPKGQDCSAPAADTTKK